MKIRNLEIDQYKNLNQFKISFTDTNRNINFVVGKNGSGKSNLLEAIAIIFKDITLNAPPSFSFVLCYEIIVEGEITNIEITGVKDGKFNFPPGFNLDKHLPHSVVTYYAGIDNKYKSIVRDVESNFAENLKKSIFKPRILFNIEYRHFDYILISLLSAQKPEGDLSESTLNILSERCNIESINTINFEISEMPNVRGETKIYYDIFIECKSSETIHNKSKKKVTYDQQSLYKLREALGAERDVLKALDILGFANIIEETSVDLNMDYIEDKKECINSTSLSEGEKQFITLLGLSEFFGYKETLYLLDEPDAFLHPNWQANLNSDLIKLNNSQQFIVTTHSPNVIQTVSKDDIFILKKGEVVNTPFTLGRDINSILLEIMDTQIRPETFNDQIKSVYSLIDKKDFSRAEKLIDELADAMGENDIEILRMKNILWLESDE
ncbi:AAA family ATPase [Litchfieldia salsa]|uniref:AAA domain-containing protein, putative AbiEii toxin, Type IV TA system n=1 Tax=Litchfieldia salsa TaxID=930152 RepID=A0A1H0PNZ0_9BACI|nr:ATP-binding protein [Litchfieldia salsa]SDP06309.1 AAA domain-containing protein, putative AbiEii toxin, Type IV TA system [Litchfieldia salsa]